MIAAEDVEREIAIAAIVAVKEAALLPTVDRVVGGVEVKDDRFGRQGVAVEEQVDEQPLDQARVVTNLVVARRRRGRGVLEPVEGRLAGQGRAVGSACGELAGDGSQHRVVAQAVVVEQILVAQRQGKHSLANQRRQAVLDPVRRPVVDEAGGEPTDQADRPVRGAQEQRPGVRRDRPAAEPGHHRPARDGCKLHPIHATLCRHRGIPLLEPKAL